MSENMNKSEKEEFATAVKESLMPLFEDIFDGISDIRTEMKGMKTEITGMKTEITDIRTEIKDMKAEIKNIDKRLYNVEYDVNSIKLAIETEIVPGIERLADGHKGRVEKNKELEQRTENLETTVLALELMQIKK